MSLAQYCVNYKNKNRHIYMKNLRKNTQGIVLEKEQLMLDRMFNSLEK